jgi:hypothetical protein
MLGLNHSDRKTPVSSRTTKLHSAISPSMNDQWSGNTLRNCFFISPARPTRSSSQVTGPAIGLRLVLVRAWVEVLDASVD